MTPVRLSVCIPTYNFGAFIGQTLEALVAQTPEDVEIVVLDSGSSDDTAAVVERFVPRCPRLVYRRTERPRGIDRDLAATVALARGEYCWLLSSDDVPAPGALQAVRDELDATPDVLLCNRVECDRALRPLRVAPWLDAEVGDRSFRLSAPADLLEYFGAARSIGALFSYLSSIVVRRERWEETPVPEGLLGSHYAHVARLFTILRGGTLRYLRAPLVLCRGENDSFARSGVVRRFQIDVDGYLKLAEALFPEPEVRRAFLAVMRLEHPWWVYAEVRSRVTSPQEWRTLEGQLEAFGYAGWQLGLVGALGGAPPLMALARAAWFGARRLRKAASLARRA